MKMVLPISIHLPKFILSVFNLSLQHLSAQILLKIHLLAMNTLENLNIQL